MTTRSSLAAVLGIALLATGDAAAAPENRAAVYERDVEFLLDKLEEKAGHFFRAKGIDWKKVAQEFRAQAKSVKTDVDHVRLCTRLVARLRDGHAGLVDLKVTLPDESEGRKWVGPGLQFVPIGERLYVRAAWSEAGSSGVKTGMEVVKVDDLPAKKWLEEKVASMRDTTGYSTDHAAVYAACHWGLGAWQGTRLQVELRSRRDKKSITLMRDRNAATFPSGPVFPPQGLKEIGRQAYGKTAKGFGYIHLRDVPGEILDQVDTMLGEIGAVPGLVLDMRANGGGGCDHEALFGRFLAPGQKWEPDHPGQYVGQGKHTYTGPMVVIVDAGVRSAGETVAGMFKEDGRAWLIGDTPTAGMSSSKEKLPVPSGLFAAYFSVASNKGRFNGKRGIEGIGVPPNEVVPYEPADLLAGVDTQIRRAEEILKEGVPKSVAYRGPPK